ncbi:DUF11 domain-containing protein [Paenibacillus sp. B01]|uniref:DUF11 domain-containing protein n=1 Tax=Paenibacillus sp. B01 TaxID=2660554 RepID=UPI00129BCE8A|nr:DUF11 domain-containing protein [Paenibacillus sp. B01]QGG57869.1 DUF11 domain-containing protein [Paenibacillus sp. B01]
MAPPLEPLHNQSTVRFQSGVVSSAAYSNTVVTFVAGPRIRLQLTASTAEAAVGGIVAYTVTAFNEGNLAGELTAGASIPPGASFVPGSVVLGGGLLPGADPAQGIYLGLLEPGGSASFRFQALVTGPVPGGALVNEAWGSATFRTPSGRVLAVGAEPAALSIPVRPAALAAYLTAGPDPVAVGGTAEYVLRLVNSGSSAATGIVVRFALPPGVAFIPGSVTLNGVRLPDADPLAGIFVGELAAGAEVGLSFAATVVSTAASGQLASASAEYVSADGEPEAVASNPVRLTIVPPDPPDPPDPPEATKRVDAHQASPGDILSYVVTASVPSGPPLYAVLADPLPAGLRYLAGSLRVDGEAPPASAGSLESGLALGFVSPGAPVTAFYRAEVLPLQGRPGSEPLPLRNEAVVRFSAGAGRPVESEVAAGPALTVVTAAAFRVAAAADRTVSEPGETVGIEIAISAIGSQPAEGFLSGFVPDGLQLLPETLRLDGAPAAVLADGLQLGRLLPGSVHRVRYSGRVAADFGGGGIAGISGLGGSDAGGSGIVFDGEIVGTAALSWSYELEGRVYRGVALAPRYRVRIVSQQE